MGMEFHFYRIEVLETGSGDGYAIPWMCLEPPDCINGQSERLSVAQRHVRDPGFNPQHQRKKKIIWLKTKCQNGETESALWPHGHTVGTRSQH
jgi:hypothetical protein